MDNLWRRPDLITLDYSLPDVNGSVVFQEIKKVTPDTPVIIISGQDVVATAIELLKAGATDYIVKDDNTTKLLLNSVNRIKSHSELKRQVDNLKSQLNIKYDIESEIIGESAVMAELKKLIKKAAASDVNVLIFGEKGVGKDFIAKLIHNNSQRTAGPFIIVQPYERELLTIQKADTANHNADAQCIAYWEQKLDEALHGTLYLNNANELPAMDQQVVYKLWELKQYVDDKKIARSKLRIIASVDGELDKRIEKGLFSRELYTLLYGLPMLIPPLRSRKKDIVPLATHIIDDYCRDHDLNKVHCSPEAMFFLTSYHYPGNTAELRTVLHLAITICNQNIIQRTDIMFNGMLTHREDKDREVVKQLEHDIVVYYMKKYKTLNNKMESSNAK